MCTVLAVPGWSVKLGRIFWEEDRATLRRRAVRTKDHLQCSCRVHPSGLARRSMLHDIKEMPRLRGERWGKRMAIRRDAPAASEPPHPRGGSAGHGNQRRDVELTSGAEASHHRRAVVQSKGERSARTSDRTPVGRKKSIRGAMTQHTV